MLSGVGDQKMPRLRGTSKCVTLFCAFVDTMRLGVMAVWLRLRA